MAAVSLSKAQVDVLALATRCGGITRTFAPPVAAFAALSTGVMGVSQRSTTSLDVLHSHPCGLLELAALIKSWGWEPDPQATSKWGLSGWLSAVTTSSLGKFMHCTWLVICFQISLLYTVT
jgi:hypothetical protein